MEKDIGKIKKNETTDVVVRIDDFGGKIGLTIREFVTGERYTGFTKAGTRIAAENFDEFKGLINSIDPADLTAGAVKTETAEKSEAKATTAEAPEKSEVKEAKPKRTRKKAEPIAKQVIEEKIESPTQEAEDY
ncbi:hypothetical protein A3K73_02995 [Candidatus Pacearchaeota archaeon RBG_13_36_9]|nr:MAG: hypothetical protein A3K73_02995 [Candidatus Pacearchaeota archaeon RBG_13_36_9]